MALRFPAPCFGILLGVVVAMAPVLAQAQNPKLAPQRRQQKPPEAPAKLPNLGADRGRGRDFLFGALKAFRKALAVILHLEKVPELVKTRSVKGEGRDI